MRTTSMSLLALLAFACHAQSCQGETIEPGKTGAPPRTSQQAGGKSDDVLSPSTLPKDRQNVTEKTGTARINALSPDEERRLQRARSRGSAADDARHPAAEAHASPTPAPKGTPASKETPAPRKTPSSPAKAATATPAAGATRDRSPSRRHATATPILRDRRASRAAGASRDTAKLDERRARARPTRPAFVEGGERRPRVGDVIPPGVALYPLPPGYGPPPGVRPAPLPFPGAQDDGDDELGAPRRAFVEPF